MRRHLVLACAVLIGGVLTAAAQEPASAIIVGGPSTYTVRPGDTLSAIAARFGVTTAAIIARNGLARPGTIVPGQALDIDNAHLAIVDPAATITINVPQRMLFFRDGAVVRGYPITVGSRAWPTPLGEFAIVDKEVNPVWDVPASIQREMRQQRKPVITRMDPSPDNPLGAYWLRLSLPGLGIHGTNAPSSIYRYASHGCIRMHPDHIAELFGRVAPGMRGVLKYQPVVMAEIDGRIWIEAHPDPYGLARDAGSRLRHEADRTAIGHRVDWQKVGAALRLREGRAEDVTRVSE